MKSDGRIFIGAFFSLKICVKSGTSLRKSRLAYIRLRVTLSFISPSYTPARFTCACDVSPMRRLVTVNKSRFISVGLCDYCSQSSVSNPPSWPPGVKHWPPSKIPARDAMSSYMTMGVSSFSPLSSPYSTLWVRSIYPRWISPR